MALTDSPAADHYRELALNKPAEQLSKTAGPGEQFVMVQLAELLWHKLDRIKKCNHCGDVGHFIQQCPHRASSVPFYPRKSQTYYITPADSSPQVYSPQRLP